MNSQITRLALGGKCRAGSAPCSPAGGGAASPRAIAVQQRASAAVPMPAAARPKKCRRVSSRRFVSGSIGTPRRRDRRRSQGLVRCDVPPRRRYSLVTVSSRLRIKLAIIVQAASSAGVERGVALATRRPPAVSRPHPVGLKSASCSSETFSSTASSSAAGAGRVAQRKANAIRVRRALAPSVHHPLGQPPGRFDVLHVVHQHERLQRRVGARAADGAGFARGASNVTSDGGGEVRFQNVYMLRRYRPRPCSGLNSRRVAADEATASHSPSG